MEKTGAFTVRIQGEIIKGALTSFTGRIVGAVFLYIYQIILVRLLSADIAGAFLWMQSIIVILATFARLGVDFAVVRLVALESTVENWRTVNGIISRARLIALCGSIIAVFIVLQLPLFNQMHGVINYMVLAIPLISMTWISTEALRALKSIGKAVIVQSWWISLGGLLLLISLNYVNEDKMQAVASAFVITHLVASILGFILLRSTLKKTLSDNNNASFRQILHVSLPMFFVSISSYWIANSEIIILGLVRQDVFVAMFNSSLKTALLVSTVLIAMNAILSPIMAVVHKSGNKDELEKIIRKAADWALFAAAPIVMLIILESKNILSIFDDAFVDSQDILIITSISQYVNVAFGPGANLLSSTTLQKSMAVIMVSSAILSFGIAWLLINLWGIYGAAVSTIFVTIFWNFLVAVTAWKSLQVRIFAKRWLIPTLFIALSLFLHFMNTELIFSPILLLLILLLTLGVALWRFVLTTGEKKLIITLLKYRNIIKYQRSLTNR